MGMRSPRTLALDPPLAPEAVWQRLAQALPTLVRMFLPYPDAADEALAATPLPEITGPSVGPDTRRRYRCGERGCFAQLDLHVDPEPWVSLCLDQRTVSNGLSVLELWSRGSRDAVAELVVGCHVDRADAVLGVLRRALAP